MIERISELETASFERQLMQKCYEYYYLTRAGGKNTKVTVVNVNNGGSTPSSSIDDLVVGSYWKNLQSGQNADTVYCIQHQIIYNIDYLLQEKGSGTPVTIGDYIYDEASWKCEDETFFWDDLVKFTEGTNKGKARRKPFKNSTTGRQNLRSANYFRDSFCPAIDNTETFDTLSSFPKTHASQSYIEVSEFVGDSTDDDDNAELRKDQTRTEGEKRSNYVSRKVTLLWFFNVIKAIVDVKTWFRRLTIGYDVREVPCPHSEAEKNANSLNSGFGYHTYLQSNNPEVYGRLNVYGNTELNGQVTTFHSQARFHKEARFWDTVNVYGQSNFSKDINGTAMRVRWGDLAEYYSSDSSYPPGTLVKFGGEKEITVADDIANAVVTTNPGLVMNEGMSGKDPSQSHYIHPLAIALVGKVPVRVWGLCRKFDLLVADEMHHGWARVKTDRDAQEPIARALESSTSEGQSVLCATNFRI